MTRRRAVLAAAGANAAAVIIVALSGNRFLPSGGSDAPNLVLSPSWFGQLLCLALMVAATVAIATGATPRKLGAAVLWVLLLLTASHRVVVDFVSGEVRDVYALLVFQRMPLGDMEGGFARLVIDRPAGRLVLGRTDGGDRMTVITGVPPAQLQTRDAE